MLRVFLELHGGRHFLAEKFDIKTAGCPDWPTSWQGTNNTLPQGQVKDRRKYVGLSENGLPSRSMNQSSLSMELSSDK
jgi:hypothetical protein